jgi:beta-lactamase superfamily II metal-dependent hydrolase
MFKLHVVQAKSGDALILSFGTSAKPRHILIDGGPSGNYAADLEPALGKIVGKGGKLDLVVLSHVDNDHVVALLDLFAAVEDDQVGDREPRTKIAGLWHNSFERTIDPTGAVERQLQAVMTMAATAKIATPLAAETLDIFYGIREGSRLRLMAKKLKIPINKGFDDDVLLVETAKAPIKVGPLELKIAGPNKTNLKALQNQWLQWLEEAAQKIGADPATAAMSDGSKPNLSSIVLLAKCDGKTILLTGDARGDHIIEGLRAAGLARNGKLHVDLLKVQHHGSNRNATPDFFSAITANVYVLSADGRHGNPKLETMKWIVEAARHRRQPITLVATNQTATIAELQKRLPPCDYGYTLKLLPEREHSVEIVLNA